MNKSPLPWSKQAQLTRTTHMARRSFYKILLPIVRFLAMLHAFAGLINYEEKDGRFYQAFAATSKDEGEFLVDVRDSFDPATLPGLLHIIPAQKGHERNVGEIKETMEEEAPESGVFHIASLRAAEKLRRRKKIFMTPFGEFAVKNLFQPFSAWGCLNAA